MARSQEKQGQGSTDAESDGIRSQATQDMGSYMESVHQAGQRTPEQHSSIWPPPPPQKLQFRADSGGKSEAPRQGPSVEPSQLPGTNQPFDDGLSSGEQ
jgi:hypothetical protein